MGYHAWCWIVRGIGLAGGAILLLVLDCQRDRISWRSYSFAGVLLGK